MSDCQLQLRRRAVSLLERQTKRNVAVLEAYRKHVAERAAEGVVPKPLDAHQVAELVKLVQNPPAGEEAVILDLLENRIPPGVDEAAYVKAAFLDAVAKGTATSPILSAERATSMVCCISTNSYSSWVTSIL